VPRIQHASVPRSACTERPLCIRPLAISAAVGAALARGHPVVKAGHRHGASIAISGTDDAVFMSAPGMGLLPAHIVVRARDLERVHYALERKRVAAVDPDETLALHIDAVGVRRFGPRLAANAADLLCVGALAGIAAVAQWLRASPVALGLGATAAELLAPVGRWRHALAGLQPDPGSAESALRSLIGLGAGTTPAGDDFAIGALAHAWVTQGERAPLIAAMRALGAELPALTSAVGATYLRAAARGEFGSHLVAWVRALPRVAPSRSLALARRVAGHGATSGRDTLAGFVAAAESTVGSASRYRPCGTFPV
jgi:hypothetical protein